MWDPSNGKQLQKLNGHTSQVNSVAFSLDGKYIVSGSDDNSVRMWDASTGAQLQVLNDNTQVTSVEFSTDGKYIVSSSHNTSVTSCNAQYTLLKSWLVLPSTKHRLMYIPSNIAKTLYHQLNTLVISPVPSFKVDFSSCKFGETWAQCYKPNSM